LNLHFQDEPPVTDADLTGFDSPPVVEVSLGFQFEASGSYNSFVAADFWQRVRKAYPRMEEQPPLEPGFETFGANDGAIAQNRIEFVPATVISPRFVLINESGSELLQFQRDRLHLNWRGFVTKEAYPRYPQLRDRFREALAEHRTWTAGHGMAAQPTQAEVVYVNRIPLVDGNQKPCGLTHLFPWLGIDGITEAGSIQFRRKLFDEDEQPVGRLHFTLQYGTDERGHREAQLVYLVRGRPQDPTEDRCLAMLDAGRKIIVHQFTQMTSPSAHSLWEKQS
jgi:uncharacterized protein (TIGR04255 family)